MSSLRSVVTLPFLKGNPPQADKFTIALTKEIKEQNPLSWRVLRYKAAIFLSGNANVLLGPLANLIGSQETTIYKRVVKKTTPS